MGGVTKGWAADLIESHISCHWNTLVTDDIKKVQKGQLWVLHALENLDQMLYLNSVLLQVQDHPVARKALSEKFPPTKTALENFHGEGMHLGQS